jgi:hypothetical protein
MLAGTSRPRASMLRPSLAVTKLEARSANGLLCRSAPVVLIILDVYVPALCSLCLYITHSLSVFLVRVACNTILVTSAGPPRWDYSSQYYHHKPIRTSSLFATLLHAQSHTVPPQSAPIKALIGIFIIRFINVYVHQATPSQVTQPNRAHWHGSLCWKKWVRV